ncbi:lysozyme g-like 1 [Hypomesus transpacificus]|uniref:lysozyme g-like 1 n=1 Tax=Hypomesus transpacificus TaxID=137520 RepID=UPI001F073361|nr:lysozyme g-like 1 [Hypomesus transpacificus]
MASLFGDIMKVETSGASEKTAKQDKLSVKGVEASHKMAEIDMKRMNQYKSMVQTVGLSKSLDPAIIAGIMSRESRAGAALDNGWGDHGNGFGLMQVDKRFHKLVGEWDSKEHVNQATGILVDFINKIQKKFPKWPKEHQLKGGISAYNAGDKNVQTYERMDVGTTGDDYSNDVVARSQWFKTQGF